MTEQTTTDLLTAVRSYIINEDQLGTSAAFIELERAMMRGSHLPSQWPQTKELEELREKVAKYEGALRDIVGYREANRDPKNRYPFPDYDDFDAVEAIAKEALKP